MIKKIDTATKSVKMSSREIRLSGLSDSNLEPDITPIDLTPLEPMTTTTTTVTTTKVSNASAPIATVESDAAKSPLHEEDKKKVKAILTRDESTDASAKDEPTKPSASVLIQKFEEKSSNAHSGSTVVSAVTLPSSTAPAISTITPLQTSPYKSNISPRHTVITRRNVYDRPSSQPVYSTNNSTTITTYSSNIAGNPISMRPTNVHSTVSTGGLVLKETRQKEKQQLSELNDRFASYVERVRFLEAQNKKLQMELSILKGKWGQETKQIEKMYQIELDEARNVLNETSKVKDDLQVKLDKSEHDLELIRKKYGELEEHLNKDKARIATLQDQIAANESEIGLLRRRLNDLQDEEKRLKQETMRMMGEIQRVSGELEFEMKQRLMLENDKQNLEEQLLFLKEIHAKEIDELKHLALQESGIDPALFFKNELASAIKEIREEYETINQTQRNDLERWYRLRVSDFAFLFSISHVHSFHFSLFCHFY